MKKTDDSIRERFFLMIVLTAIIIFSTFYINQKSGLYVDEGMTLYLSNGVYTGAVTTVPEKSFADFIREYVLRDSFGATVSNVKGMLEDVVHSGDYSKKGTVEWYDAARSVLQGKNTWMDGTTLFEMCTASENDRFDYLQVYINQAMDVHPCLYYILVHTVFSLFPGKYSVYFLYAINITCLMITCILMYRLLRRLTSWPAALMGLTVFGFCQGFVSCAMFFRMYALETLMVFVTFYFYMYLKAKDWELGRRDYVFLCLISLAGFNVHYYYIIYLFALFVLTLVDMKKKKVKCGKYVLSQIAAGLVSLIIWPFSLYHILFGYRGTEAFSSLRTFGILRNVWKYLSLFAESVFFSTYAAAVILILLIIFSIYSRKKGDVKKGPDTAIPWMELIIPMLVYFLIVSKVAPSSSSRYVMCLLPLMIIAVVCLLDRIINKLFLNDTKKLYVYLSLSVLYVLASVVFIKPEYLYREKAGHELGIDIDRSDTDCLMIVPEHYRGYVYLPELTAFEQVMVLDANLIDTLKDTRPDDEREDILLYIDSALDEEAIIASVKEYDYLQDRNITKIESDLIDFDAYYMKAR